MKIMNKYWFLSLLLTVLFSLSGCDVHTIARSNFTPIADAGVDQNVIEGDSVTLDGSASYDSYGSITAYEWKEGSNVLSTEVSFVKLDFSVGVHTIILTVTDNSNITATDSMIVTVDSVTPPLNTLPLNQDTFTISVKTDNNTSTSSLATQFEIPTTGVDYNYSVDCNNDGTNEITEQTGNYTCNYDSAGTYTISIDTGFVPRYYLRKSFDV